MRPGHACSVMDLVFLTPGLAALALVELKGAIADSTAVPNPISATRATRKEVELLRGRITF
ncbi:MAG: hypothetical protein WAM97_14195 [Acidimicrobiales bacterium]